VLRRLPLILSLSLFILFIAAWLLSHFKTIDLYYSGSRKSVGIALHRPAMLLYIQSVTPVPASRFTLRQYDRRIGDSWDSTLFRRRFLGFSYNAAVNALRIPLHLPTLACALLTLHLYRKHRRLRPTKGFEVHTSPQPGQ
jgi:hypothetical protein